MKQFTGFPPRMQFTSIPNLFFSTLLPQIRDIAELKTTLHVFEMLYRKRGYPIFTTYRELSSNKSLMSSLKETAKSPDEALRDALKMAVGRGTFIQVVLDRAGASENIYFLNTEQNRQTVDKIQKGELKLSGLEVKEPAYIETGKQPDIFTDYEENIGMLTPMIADELREAEKVYPKTWINEAIKEAALRNKRSWDYISAILERWTAEGKSDGTHRRDSKKTDPDKYVKGKYGHMVRR